MKNNTIPGIIFICACQFMWSSYYGTTKWLAAAIQFQLLCVPSALMMLSRDKSGSLKGAKLKRRPLQ